MSEREAEPLGMTIQRVAEEHLTACLDRVEEEEEEENGEEVEHSPAYGPFCGCTTCVVREVLCASWDLMVMAARLEADSINESSATDALTHLSDRLRREAVRAQRSPYGHHPSIRVRTHAAALRYAADVVEGKEPEVPSAAV